jgi:hypothetical protein
MDWKEFLVYAKGKLRETKYKMLILLILLVLAYLSALAWGYDNPFEQFIEALFHSETGQSVDVSPNLPGQEVVLFHFHVLSRTVLF